MKAPTPYAEALTIANTLLALLAPVCERIEIAGSLRRQKAEVGDVELVAIPRYEVERDLFGDEVARRSLLDAELRSWPPIRNTLAKDGDRYKQFTWATMPIDLFLVTPETWGVLFAIRTGSADFAKWLVTPGWAGGALPLGGKVQEGRLWIGGQLIATPEEADLFAAIDLPWVPPAERTVGQWGARLRAI